jgi:hypothetical protein
VLTQWTGASILDSVQAHGSYWMSDKVAEGIAPILSHSDDTLPQLGRLSTNLGGAQNAEQARKILSALVQ